MVEAEFSVHRLSWPTSWFDVRQDHLLLGSQGLKGFSHRYVWLDPSDQRLDKNSLRITPHDPVAERTIGKVEGQHFFVIFRIRTVIQTDNHPKPVCF